MKRDWRQYWLNGKQCRAVLFALAVALFIVSCSADSSEGTGRISNPDPHETPLPVLDLSQEPVGEARNPLFSAEVVASYVECQYDRPVRQAWPNWGPVINAADPDEALLAFLDDDGGYFILPLDRWVALGQDRDRRLYTHSVDGITKVAVVVADTADIPIVIEDGWMVEAYASCGAVEFDSSIDHRLPYEIWLDTEGNRVPPSTVQTRHGPEHCDLESATFLRIEGRSYVADPSGVMAVYGQVALFDDDIELPADAINAGYHRESRELWLSNDRTIAFVVDQDLVQAWPISAPWTCA